MENYIKKLKEIILKYPDLYQKKMYKKGDHLLAEDNIANNLYYIKKGIAKVVHYCEGKMKEATILFFSEDEFMSPYKSFVDNDASKFSIEVIENADMLVISKTNWQKLEQLEPEVTHLLKDAALNIVYQFAYYIVDYIRFDANKRLESILEKKPSLRRLSDEELSKHLGVTRTTINRAKKKNV
ncbi:MAG: Crp/Fnr family transcriptional regulator [Bacteroidetes bacterium]|nr:Crp/Fnr family transcriptional regulator [Bacteroidota bacterium]